MGIYDFSTASYRNLLVSDIYPWYYPATFVVGIICIIACIACILRIRFKKTKVSSRSRIKDVLFDKIPENKIPDETKNKAAELLERKYSPRTKEDLLAICEKVGAEQIFMKGGKGANSGERVPKSYLKQGGAREKIEEKVKETVDKVKAKMEKFGNNKEKVMESVGMIMKDNEKIEHPNEMGMFGQIRVRAKKTIMEGKKKAKDMLGKVKAKILKKIYSKQTEDSIERVVVEDEAKRAKETTDKVKAEMEKFGTVKEKSNKKIMAGKKKWKKTVGNLKAKSLKRNYPKQTKVPVENKMIENHKKMGMKEKAKKAIMKGKKKANDTLGKVKSKALNKFYSEQTKDNAGIEKGLLKK